MDKQNKNMDKKVKLIATTVRLDEKTSALVSHLCEKSGASQTDVIRRLIDIGLGDPSKLVLAPAAHAVCDEAAQTKLIGIAEELAYIKTALNRIGNNINVRRKEYNTARKEIQDKIDGYNNIIKNARTQYDKIKFTEEQKTLQKKLDEFDAQDTHFVKESEWERFQSLLVAFENISLKIGDGLS